MNSRFTRFISNSVCAVIAILLLLTGSGVSRSFAQMSSEGGMQQNYGRGGQRSPLMEGAVTAIDQRTIVITLQGGERREITRTDMTRFVRETRISPDQLAIGDFVRVFGMRMDGQGQIEAETIIAGASEAGGGQPTQRRLSGAGGSSQGSMGGDRSGSGRPAGPGEGLDRPVTGDVLAVSPLIVQDQSGTRTTVRFSSRTRCIREIPASPQDVQTGVFVRIIAPGRPGESRAEARKVIIADLAGQSLARSSAGPGAETLQRSPSVDALSVLQADLQQQPVHSDFIYGLWLGRGLFSNEELDRAFRVAANLGVRYCKVEVKWDYVEPEKNRYRWNDQDTLDVDHVISLAKHYRMSLIPYFDMNMPWAEKRSVSSEQGTCEGPPSRRGQYQAPDPQAYAEYVFSVIDRMKKGGADVRYVELDNESSNNSDGITSWDCFLNIPAKQLKEAHNAAYGKIKHTYPELMISSTTFLFPGMHLGPGRSVVERDVLRRNSYIKAYFGEEPKPKFDFLGIHEIISGSGNPFTSWETPVAAGAPYNFGSYHDAYAMWRDILDSYGYRNVAMINLESEAVTEGLQDADLIQRAVFARANAVRGNVRGWVLSYLTPSKKFATFRQKGMRIGITNLASGYELREGYAGFYAVMKILTRYEKYRGKITGTVNGTGAWVESFEDGKGNLLYVAFLPFQYGHQPASATETITLTVGPSTGLKITKSDLSASMLTSGADGRIQVTVTHHPIFIEVKK